MIIVFDLRRFSRNFVHSSMIFEEIESAGGEIISVSENKVDKSHLHRNPEDFLLKGHIVCQTCDRRMSGRYNSMSEHGKTRRYAVYACTNHRNKYDACPERPTIRTDKVDQLVWEDCCRVFERLDAIRDVIV